MRRRLTRADVLTEMIRAVNASLEPERVADAIVARVSAWIPVPGWLVLASTEDGEIRPLASRGIPSTLEAAAQDVGELVAPRTPLVVITDQDHAWGEVFVDEPIVPRVKLGQPATVITDAGQRIPGKLTYISPRAEFTPRNVQTAEERSRLVYRVKVSVNNASGVLKPGMPVEAEIQLQQSTTGR